MIATINADTIGIVTVPVLATITRMIATSTRAVTKMGCVYYRQITTNAVLVAVLRCHRRSNQREGKQERSDQTEVPHNISSFTGPGERQPVLFQSRLLVGWR